MKRIIISLIVLTLASWAYGRISLDLETGLVVPGYNDTRIPNAPTDPSTPFSLTEDLKVQPQMFGRANVHWLITPRHELSLLVSPITIKPSGTLPYDVVFMGETFEANKPIDAVYRFNSYRLQYLYRFKDPKAILRGIGVSLKVRDAEISLKNEDTSAAKTDLAPVPLIGIELGYDINDELGILLKGEGLWSPFGRAEDFLLAGTYKIDDRYTFYMGYRLLEGGSDIDELLTFAFFNYLSVGTQIRF